GPGWTVCRPARPRARPAPGSETESNTCSNPIPLGSLPSSRRTRQPTCVQGQAYRSVLVAVARLTVASICALRHRVGTGRWCWWSGGVLAVSNCRRRYLGRVMDGMRQDELAEIDAMMAEGEPVEVTDPFDPVRRVRFELVGGGPHAYVGGSSPP